MPPATQEQYEATKTALASLTAALSTDETNAETVVTAQAQLDSATQAKSDSGTAVQAALTAVIDAAKADGFSVTPTPAA